MTYKHVLMFSLMGCFFSCLYGHEGHHVHQNAFTLKTFLNKIGYVHLIFVHFPIALITMTVVAESLALYSSSVFYRNAAYFMLLSAAILIIPTVLAGLAFGYGQIYTENALFFYTWHQYMGLLTGGLTLLTAYLRIQFEKGQTQSLKYYYFCLIVLFSSVFSTATIGGNLAFR